MLRQSRHFTIKGRVFNRRNIEMLARSIEQHGKATEQQEPETDPRFKRTRLEFTLRCTDDTTYGSDSPDVFVEDGPIDSKRARSIEMEMSNYGIGKRIHLELYHGDGRYLPSKLIVEADDGAWGDAVFTQLKELIESIQPQTNLLLKYQKLWFQVIALGAGTVMWAIIDFIVSNLWGPNTHPTQQVQQFWAWEDQNPWFTPTVTWASRWLYGQLAVWPLRDWMYKLWPSIEFDFGPEHLRAEKRARNLLWAVLTIVAIPLALQIGHDVAVGPH